MKIEYYPEVDMLRILLRPVPYQAEGGSPAFDDDLVLFYDETHRLAEVEVSQASKRIDLGHLRGSGIFEEVTEAPASA